MFLAWALPLALLQAAGGDSVALFDGKSLAGWHISAKPADRDRAFWTVKDGVIRCDSRGRRDHDYVWLVSDCEYGDFDLTLKVRGFRESTGNSGIQIRSRYDETAFWLDGPQIDVHPPSPWRTGWIYDETRGTRRWISPSLPDSKIAPEQGSKEWTWKYAEEDDGWNDLRIVCEGTRIRTWLNGRAVTDYDGKGLLDDDTHRKYGAGLKGHIALQLHIKDDVLIEYKDLVLRPMR